MRSAAGGRGIWARAWPAPADLTSYVGTLDIPYSRFTLPNGLRVIVHTDRSTPMVSLNVLYDVGSKHEPQGRTGFAHLFEHLMFSGSENLPGDYMKTVEEAGAAAMNGATSSDLTSYYEVVPVGALERALFMESDRMGYLLGTISRRKLDEQRGVVQNEKRQGDNSPYGLVDDRVIEALYPRDHPYGHSTIGSMADLDAASLDDVKGWFRSHYAPNNAVLVLAGDIDEATARRLVTRYFAQIPAGPRTVRPEASVPTLPHDVNDTMTDRVAAPMIVRAWAVPGQLDSDYVPLDAAATTLGQMETSPLEDVLVRREKLFNEISAGIDGATQGSTFMIRGIVADGVDPMKAGRRLDAVLADYLRAGPSVDSLRRYVAQTLATRLPMLESNNAKASQLGMDELLAGDPGHGRKELVATVAQTPDTVRTAAAKWLGRPAYRLTVMPGARNDAEEAAGPAIAPPPAEPAPMVTGTRGPLPPVVAPVEKVSFPAVEHLRLANGMEVAYAHVTRSPMTLASLTFDAGTAADVADRLGTEQLTVDVMQIGTGTMDATAIAEEREQLGASLDIGVNKDRTVVDLKVPSINFPRALDLMAAITRRPAFAKAEVARKRTELLAQIQQELTDPQSIGARLLSRLANPGSPYAKGIGSGDPAAVARLTRADLVAFYRAWFRPDKAKLFVVSDRPLAEIKPLLERAYGDWTATGAAGSNTFPVTMSKPRGSRIVLIDLPDVSQSLIGGLAGTPLKSRIPMQDAQVANDAFGGGFASRINTDLRERRHWTYGASSSFVSGAEAVAFSIIAPVQEDRTADSIGVMRDQLARFVTTEPITRAEFDRAIDTNVKSSLSAYASTSSILSTMKSNDRFGRPDDYATTLPGLYRGLTIDRVRTAFRTAVDPAAITWLVIGDAAKIRPQLQTLKLPIEDMTPLGTAR